MDFTRSRNVFINHPHMSFSTTLSARSTLFVAHLIPEDPTEHHSVQLDVRLRRWPHVQTNVNLSFIMNYQKNDWKPSFWSPHKPDSYMMFLLKWSAATKILITNQNNRLPKSRKKTRFHILQSHSFQPKVPGWRRNNDSSDWQQPQQHTSRQHTHIYQVPFAFLLLLRLWKYPIL